MVLVVLEVEVLERVVRDALGPAPELQRRVRVRLVAQLFVHLVDVVVVDVNVTTRPYELAQFQVALVCDHHRQQRVAGDVERDAKEHVAASLVELARQLAVLHVELEERVAGRQRRRRNVLGVPRCHHQTARVRVVLDLLHHVGDLVDDATLTLLPLAPLSTVDLTDVTVLGRELIVLQHTLRVGLDLLLPLVGVLSGHFLAGGLKPGLEGPFRPDVHTVLQQETDVRVPA